MSEKNSSVNPDSRPLPPGWNEHYDSARQTWYYVYLNGSQPKVSLRHPAELLSMNQPTSIQDISPSGKAAALPQRAQNLSFAQQLYASALPKNVPASTSQFTQPPRPTSLPTPPPSNSPPPRWSPRALPSIPTPPITALNPIQDTSAPKELYNPVISLGQRRPISGAPTANPIHNASFEGALPSTIAHRHLRNQASLPDRQLAYHYRASTVSPGAMSTPPRSRHLVTAAKPPPLNHSRSMASLAETNSPTSPGAHRPQSFSVHNNQLIPGSTGQMQSGLSPSVVNHSFSVSPPTSQTHPTPGNQAGQILAEIGKSVVKALGRAALQSAGKAIKSTFFGADTVSDIITSFAGVSPDQFGIGILQLEAVMQGSITADYQAVINALLKLQHRPNLQPQQLAHPIDYPALISKLQKAQEMAHDQLQQLQQLAQQQQIQQTANMSTPTLAQYQTQFQQQLQQQQQQQPTPALSPASHTSSPPSTPAFQQQNPAPQAVQQHNMQVWIQQQQQQAQQNLAQQPASMQQGQSATSSQQQFQMQQILQQQQQQGQAQMQAILQSQAQQQQNQEAQFQAILNAQQIQLQSQTSLYQNAYADQPSQNSLPTDSFQAALGDMNAFGSSYDQPPGAEAPPPFDPEMLYQDSASLGNFSVGFDESFSSDSMLSDASGNFADTFANLGTSFDASGLVSGWNSES